MKNAVEATSNKVPQITIAFWIIKILATTLGETGGDALSMSMGLGYAVSSLIFLVLFLVCISAQISAKSYHPFLYWSVIITTTTLGTTMADYADRSIGIGYAGGSAILFIGLMLVLLIWKLSEGSVSVTSIHTKKGEMFYWLTILFSQTLGTALGDYLADGTSLGYEGGALVFIAALFVVALAYFYTNVSHVLLFWMAFILTRPLGATLGDLLTKPIENGGLNLNRYSSSVVLFVSMLIGIILTNRQKRVNF